MGKSVFDLYATDPAKEAAGRWFRLGDSEFLLTYSGAKATKAAMSSAMMPLQRQQKLNQLGEDDVRGALAAPLAKYVLIDWRTKLDNGKYADHQIEGRDGMLTYSKKAAQDFLMDCPAQVFSAIMDQSSEHTLYAPDDVELAIKN